MKRRIQDRRTPTRCANCGSEFLRACNTRYCSTACRLIDKVVISDDGCWNWAASRDSNGYGTFSMDGRTFPAHRVSFELLRGPIADGLHIDHLCRNRACVNPDHLEPVTQRENTLRGNAPTAVLYRLGVCSKGHELTPENTYRLPSNPRHRQCRKCISEYVRNRRSAL